MYWTEYEYPSDMRRLPERIREKAIEIANELQTQGYQEMKAIPIAIAQAREWWRNTRRRCPEFTVPRR
jgi:uncharacterized protein YdaT